MSKWILVAFLVILVPIIMMGQNRATPFFTTKNYISYQFGLAYPFYGAHATNYYYNTDKIQSQYTFSDKGINYGFYAGLGYGHLFGKVFSMSFCPSIMYSKFSNTDFNYEARTPVQQALIVESHGIFHFSHVSFIFPLDLSFRINNRIEASIGGFILKPISTWEYSLKSGTQYLYYDYHGSGFGTYQPPLTYTDDEYKDKDSRSFGREGLHGQLSIKVKERDWQQQRILIDYYYSLEDSNFDVREHYVRVGFTKLLFQ
jgi:hypothetical protein